MKYWIFQSNQVCGPYDADELSSQPGFSSETLVCPEGNKGTSMGDWQRAGMVPALAQTAAGSVPASAMPAASPGPAAEPNLKDLASLGSLQEKMAFLENSLSQFQEGLRAKDSQLSDLRDELDTRKSIEDNLHAKLKELEEQMATVSRMRESLDVAAAAKNSVEGEVKGVENLVQNMESSVQEVKNSVSGVSTTVKDLENLLAKQNQTMSALTLEVEHLKSERANAPSAAPAAAAQPPAAEEGYYPPTQNALPPAAGYPGAPVELPPASAPIPAADIPAAAETAWPSADKTVSLPPPSGSEPAAAVPPPAMDYLPTAPMFPGPETPADRTGPTPHPSKLEDLLGSPPPGAPEPLPPASAPVEDLVKPKPKKAALVAALVGGAVLVMGLLAFWSGFLGTSDKSEVSEPAAAAAPDPNGAAPSADIVPQAPDPNLQAEELKRQAIELVQTWPAGDGLESVGLRLESAHPTAHGASWLAEKLGDDLFQVNFYGASPGSDKQTVYEFQASPVQKTVTPINDAAKLAASGRPMAAKKKSRTRSQRAAAAASEAAPPALPIMPQTEPQPAEPVGEAALAPAPAQPAASKKRKRRKKPAAAEAGTAPSGAGTTLIDTEKTTPPQAADPTGLDGLLSEGETPAPPAPAKKKRSRKAPRKAQTAAPANPQAAPAMPGYAEPKPEPAPEAGLPGLSGSPEAAATGEPAAAAPAPAPKKRAVRVKKAAIEKPAIKTADDAALLDELLQP
ncbi:MAG: hypothetical protein WC881_06045 [Elusimicrobiota bacterium]|jgi:hypothetical protein